jgi:hypothetical protein
MTFVMEKYMNKINILVLTLLTLWFLYSCAAYVLSSFRSRADGTYSKPSAPETFYKHVSGNTYLVGRPANYVTTEIVPDSAKSNIMEYLAQCYLEDDVKALSYTDVGAGHILINIDLKTSTNHFVLYNLSQNILERLPIQDAELREVVNENYFIFHSWEENSNDAIKSIPFIDYCFRSGTDENDFTVIRKIETLDLSQSIQIGSQSDESLSDLVVTGDGIQILFTPIDGATEDQMYFGTTDIPPTVTSYDKKTNQLMVEISATQIERKLMIDTPYTADGNLYITSYVIQTKGDNILLLLSLNDCVSGFATELKKDSISQNLYLDLSFGNSPDDQI